MILSGILHTSLGGFTVIRGVAPLGELARCSESNEEFQRNLIPYHCEGIARFLADQQYLFFPEVILSASLLFDFNAYKGKRPVNPINDILSGRGFTSNVNALSVKVVKTKPPKQVVGGPKRAEIAYFELPEEQIDNGLKLSRIDGNHRLSAVQGAKKGDARYNLPTPFCVVLYEELNKAQHFEEVVFHNINAKQIPLTSEENLRLILENDQVFPDKVLRESPSFGPAYYLARKLLAVISDLYLTGLRKPLGNRRTLALSLTQFLAASDDPISQAKDAAALDAQVERLLGAFQVVNTIYQQPNRAKLAESGCHGVLVAFIYFALCNEGKQISAFERWIVSNRIDHLAPTSTIGGLGCNYPLALTQAVDAASLVIVFKSILAARKREIFISMAFCEETNETYETIKKTVRQINDKYLLDIELLDIRIDQFNKGHSYTINDEILKVIEGSGLLIADLTFGNRNVYHEIGYLMGLNRGRGLEQDNFILIADKKARGNELESDIGFNLKSWQQLRFESTRQLEESLTESLEFYYNLKGNAG